MSEETGLVYEWKIENLSHWCGEVHGDCIKSPECSKTVCRMVLYPKGRSGQGEHLVVRLLCVGYYYSASGELSFYSSDGSLLCKQQLIAGGNTCLELPPGPKFKDVLSRLRKSEDFITLKLWIKCIGPCKKRVCTTINVLKISLEINPGWIEEMKSNATKEVFYIQLTPNDNLKRMWLKICFNSENNTVHFTITPPTEYENPFAVEMNVSLTRSDGTVVSCVKKEHVFRDDSPWTFPDSLLKKELVERGISLFFCLKTKNLVQSPFYLNCVNSCVSIKRNNIICFSEEAPSTDPVTSNKVLTKDSGSQTTLTSAIPDNSVLVLSKELMCLYQDQKFSDITLKCDNVSFPVHKNILSARSPVLDRLLSSDMKEAASGEVVIGDLDPSTLALFLTYLYTGAVEEELQCESALKLYYAADKYQVPSLKKDCSKFLCSNVSISNVCDILSLADRHGDDQLMSVAQEFILSNYNNVLKSKEWESFMCREPLLAVKTLTHFAAKDSVCQKA